MDRIPQLSAWVEAVGHFIQRMREHAKLQLAVWVHPALGAEWVRIFPEHVQLSLCTVPRPSVFNDAFPVQCKPLHEWLHTVEIHRIGPEHIHEMLKVAREGEAPVTPEKWNARAQRLRGIAPCTHTLGLVPWSVARSFGTSKGILVAERYLQYDRPPWTSPEPRFPAPIYQNWQIVREVWRLLGGGEPCSSWRELEQFVILCRRMDAQRERTDDVVATATALELISPVCASRPEPDCRPLAWVSYFDFLVQTEEARSAMLDRCR